MLKQCLAAPVHRAQRSQIRRCDMELLTEMPPEHRWHDAHRIEYSATHAQEPHLQRQPQLELRPTAFFNDLAFGRCKPKKRLNLEGRQFTREMLQTQKRGLPVVHRTLLKPSAIASLKSRTASSCFYLGRAREALKLPRNPTASYCIKNEGTPTTGFCSTEFMLHSSDGVYTSTRPTKGRYPSKIVCGQLLGMGDSSDAMARTARTPSAPSNFVADSCACRQSARIELIFSRPARVSVTSRTPFSSEETSRTQPFLNSSWRFRLTVDRSNCSRSPSFVGAQVPILPSAAIRLACATVSPCGSSA